MTSQTIQQWHTNPQLIQPQQPPQGWTGSWPPDGNVAFPPGYPGPPPMPSGAAASSHWNVGYWQYNPYANMQDPQRPWAPGGGWFPPAPNGKARKRVPRPPSPSYWNTKLMENGLGLEGMVKRKEPYDGEPPTPWIWNPPSLLEGGDHAAPTRDFNGRRTGVVDNSLRDTSIPTQHQGQKSRRSSKERFSPSYWNTKLADNGLGLEGMVRKKDSWAYYDEEPQTPRIWNPPSLLEGDGRATPTRDFNSRRTGVVDNSLHNASTSTDPSDIRPGQSRSGFAGPSTSSQRSRGQSDSWFDRTHSQPLAANEVPPYPAPKLTISISRSASKERDSFTSSAKKLRPTFSPNIIRTPLHYQEAHRNNEEVSSDYHSRSPSPAGYSSTPTPRPPIPEITQSSLPIAPSSMRDVYRSFAQDSPSSTEVIARFTMSHESMLSALPSGEIVLAPLRDPGGWSSADSSPYVSHLWSTTHVRDPYVQGNAGAQPQPPVPGGSRRENHNPLPPPPVERSILDASRPPVQEHSPPRYAHKVRTGFWNRRGDHLTANGYVVYAPHDRAYPEELRDYPDEREGYRDQYGTMAAWRRERPELPASLAYLGRPPTSPYESFVVYMYLR